MELPASYQLNEKEKSIHLGTTFDISGLGISLIMRDRPEVAQELTVNLSLSEKEKIQMVVKVIWVKEVENSVVKEYKVGARLVEPPKKDELKFVRFFAKKFAEYFNPEQKDEG